MFLAFSILVGALTAVYCGHLLFFFVGLFRLKKERYSTYAKVSVVVPARNEEACIGDCLSALLTQQYPRDLYEIIVVDDQSEDRTAQIAKAFAKDHENLKLISAGSPPGKVSPKKHAVNLGIASSSGEIILVTDADCVAAPDWLPSMVRCFSPEVGMVAGCVVYRRDPKMNGFFYGIQALDFLSHLFCAAGAIGMGRALTCNAANLAYRREVFEEVGGFVRGANLISGDDDFLIQEVSRRTSWKVKFALSEECLVTTRPAEGFRAFFHQRMRWASKGRHYHPHAVFFLSTTFLFYLLLSVGVPISLAHGSIFSVPAIGLLGKVAFDGLVVVKGCHLFHQMPLLRFFPLAEMIHIPYILAAVVGGNLRGYAWKGRWHRRGRADLQQRDTQDEAASA